MVRRAHHDSAVALSLSKGRHFREPGRPAVPDLEPMTDTALLEAWFERLPEAWQARAQRVRELVLESASGMEEKWMFKSTPFYLHCGWMCYFGFKTNAKKSSARGQLILGFCAGVHMNDPERLFAVTEHTLIRYYLVPPPTERLNEPALRRLLHEAVGVNEAVAEERRAKRGAERKR